MIKKNFEKHLIFNAKETLKMKNRLKEKEKGRKEKKRYSRIEKERDERATPHERKIKQVEVREQESFKDIYRYI